MTVDNGRIKGNTVFRVIFSFFLTASFRIPLFVFSDGKFKAYMQVHIQNDGPVTIDIESPKQQQKQVR